MKNKYKINQLVHHTKTKVGMIIDMQYFDYLDMYVYAVQSLDGIVEFWRENEIKIYKQ